MTKYTKSKQIAQTAPDNFLYLFHEFWKDAKDQDHKARTEGVVERIEKEIKDRE